ncbi:MAG: hypothetical protein JWN92_2389, partial [Candidatus Acidoferrum typicum]|nr:hypothetical protein [Candidatus Acidoferrum typicum]
RLDARARDVKLISSADFGKIASR